VWRRIQILKLLDKGWNLTATGEALDTYAREVRRVGWRYLDAGLDAALTAPGAATGVPQRTSGDIARERCIASVWPPMWLAPGRAVAGHWPGAFDAQPVLRAAASARSDGCRG
jgi:hypothetical protein